MSLVVELFALELFAHHGVLPEERERGQTFLVDLWLTAGEEAAATDRIEDAVDYRAVVDTVREVSDGHQYALLEAFAAAIADMLLARFPLEAVRVRVRKPDVGLAVPVEFSAVSLERHR